MYVLLPLSLVLALALVSQGVIQNFSPYREVTTLEGGRQTLAMGPVASQEAIKQLGTNGGGFFNANAAHPFENPTPVSNFLSMLAIFLIPAGLTHTFGRMAGDARQGWALFAAMALLFFAGAAGGYWAESAGNPQLCALGVEGRPGNMEGKEVRFGVANSALYATVTTDASCGAVNAMHDSFTPLGGLVPLFNIQLGEVVFGGVGAGLYGMLVMAILSVFIAGLMVGRTPEYLGKKIEAREVKLAMVYVLIFPLVILVLAAWSAVAPVRNRVARQRRPARPQRNPVRVHQRRRQQRLGVWRARRQHSLVQLHARPRDADGPLPHDRAGPGDRRHRWRARRPSPPGPGTLPTNGAAVRLPPGRRHHHRRRP